jgi:hypothetical protein
MTTPTLRHEHPIRPAGQPYRASDKDSWPVVDIKGMLERHEPFWAPAFEVAGQNVAMALRADVETAPGLLSEQQARAKVRKRRRDFVLKRRTLGMGRVH